MLDAATRGARAGFSVLLLFAALGAACERTPVDGAPSPATAAAGTIPAVQIAENFEATMWQLDPYTIDSARIAGDTLTIALHHGGGCATHAFSLAASRAFRESMPVQVSAVLTHDANGDSCKALLSRTLQCDLRPLRDAYRTAYRTQAGSLVIHLWHAGQSVRYEF